MCVCFCASGLGSWSPKCPAHGRYNKWLGNAGWIWSRILAISGTLIKYLQDLQVQCGPCIWKFIILPQVELEAAPTLFLRGWSLIWCSNSINLSSYIFWGSTYVPTRHSGSLKSGVVWVWGSDLIECSQYTFEVRICACWPEKHFAKIGRHLGLRSGRYS